MSKQMNTAYDADPQSGRWLCEDEAIQISLSLKSTLEAAAKDLIDDNFEILIYANSNRAINDKQQRGGRFTFTIPRSLFMQILPVRETSIMYQTMTNRNNIAVQRAPGKAIRLKLREGLTYDEKFAAVAALAKYPLLVKLYYNESENHNRLNFAVAVSSDWAVG